MADFNQYCAIFKALSDPLRLRLLGMLPSARQKDSLCVCELAETLGISQPCLSHHLNILKSAGLVSFEKDGCSSFYYVNCDYVEEQIEEFCNWMESR